MSSKQSYGGGKLSAVLKDRGSQEGRTKEVEEARKRADSLSLPAHHPLSLLCSLQEGPGEPQARCPPYLFSQHPRLLPSPEALAHCVVTASLFIIPTRS